MKKEKWAKVLGTGFGAFLIGALVGEIAPDPTDLIHLFIILPYLKVATGWEYWVVAIFDWYFLTAIWYAFLLALTFFWRAEKIRKVSVVVSILVIGAIIGIIGRAIAGV